MTSRSITAPFAIAALFFVINAGAQDRVPAVHLPENAVESLDVADGLEISLFASEPMIVNPTNIDIDARGRIWVAEGYNYRNRLNPNNPVREEGDRIVILEDTNGDGRADKHTVFYQGNDVNAALGIAVLGNRVIVSSSPDVFILSDTDGDDRADEKELLFTGMGGEQHDHAVHAFVFGPDGKLYFNFGNAGEQLADASGARLIDASGEEVVADGEPYREGMVFRLNPDGTGLEVLGHNFRNNYEVAVDSYGTLWQSDNDDDGNRAVRINFVMEFGNYGYKNEITGAHWDERRTGMHPEIPLRHWHQNDPGVVPNLLQTGAGSPTGMAIYEGDLLPEIFQGQMIHADAGPNVVRAYPVQPSGAGYSAELVNIVETSENDWFRPSDVAVAPDGSLFIADWYDPGVGGHHVGDLDRGRIFRVAPPGSNYAIASPQLNSAAEAVEALQSPNMALRYLAWQRLETMGADAMAPLEALLNEGSPRMRARALWALGKLSGSASAWVDVALQDEDPNIRIVGLRLARQLGLDMLPLVRRVVGDASPQVRREALIALRHNEAPGAAELWTDLALQHDGSDRWYLEALGIAADRQWDRFFDAWLSRVETNWNTPGGRDIVWRARSSRALPFLAELAGDTAVPHENRLRYFRALDFHDDSSKNDLLLALVESDEAEQPVLAATALQHVDPEVLNASPRHRQTMEHVVGLSQGSETYVDLVVRFGLTDQSEGLLNYALAHPNTDAGVLAARHLLGSGQADLFRELFENDPERALVALQVLAGTDSNPARDLAEEVLLSERFALPVREAAVRTVSSGWTGQERLLTIVKEDRLPADLREEAARVLFSSYRQDVRVGAAKHLPLPGAGERDLPPVQELAERRGDRDNGHQVFIRTCGTCHQVGGAGIAFGPDLSEIGGKLSREALYVSILQPDAGISFGYEGYDVETGDGRRAVGYVSSETNETLELRMLGGASQTFDKEDLIRREPLEHSLMPPNLHQTMTEQDLIDLVEYLKGLDSR